MRSFVALLLAVFVAGQADAFDRLGRGGFVGHRGGIAAAGDTEAPTDPTSLVATTQSASQINLAWTASTDNVGVTGYNVERCTGAACSNWAQIDTAPTNSYNNTGLSASTLYRYRARAYDAATNTSGYSNIDEDTTNSGGTVRNAASCSRNDVNTAMGLAQAGDTVHIPSGTCAWTSGISWTPPANVTLEGNGTDTHGGGDATVITDNYGSNNNLLEINTPATGVFRMRRLTVESGSGATKDGGTIRFSGNGNIRIDHVTFDATSSANYQMLTLGGGVFGVLHDSILNLTGTNAIYLYNGRSGGGFGDYQANYEWTQPTNFGTSDYYFYIEDNTINGTTGGATYDTRVFDGFTGSKVVLRFNTVAQATLSETHATGHSPDDRGLRSQEVYGNLVTSSLAKFPNFTMMAFGSGTAMVWANNSANGGSGVYKNIHTINVTRKDNATYSQSAVPNGWGYCGTQFNGTGSNWDGGTALGTNTTTGYPCLDQPGRGPGDLLKNDHPNKLNDSTETRYWPNQALEPIYIWNNTGGIVSGWGGTTYNDDSGGRVQANRDYYQQASGVQTSPTSPFNGTSGAGWGTLANRPTTCTTGVGYFATDQGSWNTSSSNPYGVQFNGADGVLYKCTATNTWTLYYTPLTYPHPLRG